MTPSHPPPRRRGGQPGNCNALKHGFYAHAFTQRERERLNNNVEGQFHDEEALLRILIDRAWEALQDADMPYEDWLEAVRTITHAIGRAESLNRTRRFLFERVSTVQSALDELAHIPIQED